MKGQILFSGVLKAPINTSEYWSTITNLIPEELFTVVAPAYYSTTSGPHLKYFLTTAKHYRIPYLLYGVGKPYTNWEQVQIVDLLNVLQTEVTTPYIIYTDASDAFFLSGMYEIENKYNALGCPDLLFSLEQSGINAGGWMGSREVAIAALKILSNPPYNSESNPQIRWRMALHDIGMAIDFSRSIFQVSDSSFKVVGSRIYNTHYATSPCILHFAGGYTDPEQGKALLIEPTWNALGYDKLME